MTVRIAVVVPVLNEAVLLPAFLAHVVTLAGLHQLIICDGGSDDGSQRCARRVMQSLQSLVPPALRVDYVETTGGRHHQLNAAVSCCAADVLLCCAVDVRLQVNVCADVAAAVAAGAGHGCLYQRSTLRRYDYRVQERWAQLRSRITGCAYMDQAPFWTCQAIVATSGFRECGTYDTADMSRRIGARHAFALVPSCALSSCRAWAGGFWRQTWRNQKKRVQYMFSH